MARSEISRAHVGDAALQFGHWLGDLRAVAHLQLRPLGLGRMEARGRKWRGRRSRLIRAVELELWPKLGIGLPEFGLPVHLQQVDLIVVRRGALDKAEL